jgi:phosphatidylglycerol---prolipoprotein diacylglyceryl transferase
MWPVLFTLSVPAPFTKPLAVVLLLVLALGRAWAFRRRLAPGQRVRGWGAALWDDKATVGLVALALAALWRAGVLDGPLSLPVHSYGLMIAAGFIAGISLAQREARRQGLDAERVGDLAVVILVAALLGSRLYFIAVNWRDYFGDSAWIVIHGRRLPRLLAVWEGGLVFYGGFLGATLAALWYMHRHAMSFFPYADAIIPSVALGHFFGRLGCFGAGCCWGAVSHAHLPWLAKFPPTSLAYQSFIERANAAELLTPDRLTTLPVHPTQLYESLGELALFAVLTLVIKPTKRFHGQVLASWLMAYAVLRSVVELFRGDLERGVVAGFGVGQWTSILVFAAGVAVWVVGRGRARRALLERGPAVA